MGYQQKKEMVKQEYFSTFNLSFKQAKDFNFKSKRKDFNINNMR